MSGSAAPADALRRRLRDDPQAVRSLDALRRAAYGREAAPAPTVRLPDAVRMTPSLEAEALPAPLVALMTEEARLVDEGRALLATDAAQHAEHDEDHDRDDDDSTTTGPGTGPGTEAAPDPAADRSDREPEGPDRVAWNRRLVRPGPLATALAAALLVAGLGSASASGLLADDDGWRAQEPTSTPRPPSTPDPRIGMPVPEFTAEAPSQLFEEQTAAETAAALRTQADGAWELVLLERPDAVRPDLPVERVLEGEEWVRQHAACLAESGVRVQVIGTGTDTRLGGHSADTAVEYACSVRFPYRPLGPPTDATLTHLHDYYLDFLLPCYASEGEAYEGEVPDRAAFIARARAGDEWQPTADVVNGVLESRCPSVPPALR